MLPHKCTHDNKKRLFKIVLNLTQTDDDEANKMCETTTTFFWDECKCLKILKKEGTKYAKKWQQKPNLL